MSLTGNRYLDNVTDPGTDAEDDYNVHEIVQTGTYLEVKEVIAKDRPRLIALKDKLGRTPLHYAVLFDRTKIALFLISKNADINARDFDDATPLHLAAGQGLTDMCRFLFEFQANYRLKDTNCWTALHHAVDANHMETATLLVKRGVDLHAEDHKFGRTALHIAAEKGYTEMAEMLIIRGASLAASGDAFYSKTPLHLACINGHTNTVRVLCQRGADVNALSGLLDKTPLHFAIEKGYTEVVRVLLEYKADVNQMGKHTNGSTPLHYAAQFNHFQIADLLLRHPEISINQQGKFTTLGTPLHTACQYGHSHIVYLLIDYKADLSLLDENGHNPLHIACLHQRLDLITYLIECHANPTQLSLKKKTPIDYIENPTVREEMRKLVEKIQRLKQEEKEEMERQKRIQEQRTIILAQQLALQKQREFEKKLLQEIQRNDFMKSLILICDKSGDVNALVRLCEEYGSNPLININDPLILLPHLSNNPNFREFRNVNLLPEIPQSNHNNTGVMPSSPHKAITHSSETCFSTQLALSGGSQPVRDHNNNWDLNSQSSLGSIGSGYSTIFTTNKTHATALTLAALRGYYELVQGLLQWPGIQINVQENTGNTALHNAALINSRDICELLLLHGADNRIINQQGKTAANLATKLSLQEIIRNPKLIAAKQHLQNTIIRSIFEKKQKLLAMEGESSSFPPVTNKTPDIAKDPLPTASNLKSLKSVPTTTATNNNKPNQNFQTNLHSQSELNLRDLLVEKELLIETESVVAKSAAKNIAANSHLPIIASQFTNNIIPLVHQKENPKVNIQKALATAPGKKPNNNPFSDSSFHLPEIPGVKGRIHNNSRNNSNDSIGSGSSGKRGHPIAHGPRRYGPIPESFGGCRTDFFQMTLYTSKVIQIQQQQLLLKQTSEAEEATKKEVVGEDLALFADLFHLQKSYLPTAFDQTSDWHQMKDFLWCFGYPYRHQTIRVMIPANNSQTQYYQRQQYYPSAPPSMLEVEEDDKRAIIYQLAKLLNDCQRSFTLPSDEILFEQEGAFQQKLLLPVTATTTTAATTTSGETGPYKEEKQDLPADHHCLESRLTQFLQFNNYCLLQQLMTETPSHISYLEDFYKILLFSNYCFLGLSYLLYFFHPTAIIESLDTYLSWAKDDYYQRFYLPKQQPSQALEQSRESKRGLSAESSLTTEAFYEYRLYLLLQYEKEIYLLPSQYPQFPITSPFCQELLSLLKYSMIQSYDQFIEYYNYYYPDQAHVYHHPSFQYHPLSPPVHTSSEVLEQQVKVKQKKKQKTKKARKSRKFAKRRANSRDEIDLMNSILEGEEEEEEAAGVGEKGMRESFDDNDNDDNNSKPSIGEEESEIDSLLSYQDPLKQVWGDIIVNPPRSLRTIIDIFYELSVHLQPWLERLYPNDVVRGHLWVEEATAMMERLMAEERERLRLEVSIRQRKDRKESQNDDDEDDELDPERDMIHNAIDRSKPEPSISNALVLAESEDKKQDVVPSVPFTPLQCWLADLQLLEYEPYFLVNGFKMLEDFQELNHDDCYVYFPFLKIGDLRRMSKNILALTDEMVEGYKRKCQPTSL